MKPKAINFLYQQTLLGHCDLQAYLSLCFSLYILGAYGVLFLFCEHKILEDMFGVLGNVIMSLDIRING